MTTGVESAPAAPDAPEAPAAAAPRPRRRRGRAVALGFVLVVVALVAALAWVGYRAYGAVNALQDARVQLDDVTAEHGLAQLQAIDERLPAVQDATARARERVEDPVWSLAEHAPWLGAQLVAVRTVAQSLDDVAVGALPAAEDAGALLTGDGLRGADGRIDLAAMSAVQAPLASSAQIATDAAGRVAAIDRGPLVGPLRDAVVTVDDALDEASSTLTSAATTAALMPGMLGADEPRTYLVLALNSAELRSAGGIVGSALVVRVDDGEVTLVQQKAARHVAHPDEPVVALTADEVDVQGENVGRWIQDTVMTPDFPRTAQLARELWLADGGPDVDAVLALDPVAVQLMLEATGPLALPDGTVVDSKDFLQRTLRGVYLEAPDDAAADEYFASVAAGLLAAVASGAGESDEVVSAALEATDQRRVRVWSADPDEQATLAATTLGGAFLSGQDGASVGVFLDDATAGKLDYDLTADVTVEDLECSGAAPTATVRIALAYDPPADLLTWRDEILGTREESVPRGWLATRVTVFGPQGTELPTLRTGDGFAGRAASEAGRPVQQVSSLLAPGESVTYLATVPVVDGRVDVWTTPTADRPGHVAVTCQ
ncbi:DUF4012 domain-containing protein [Cellulomonas composti]|uniref:DUF4012 domain-containing protein n=1 Tax=Cellulomonas composti TaxID=266130 RepID=A0A511JCV8_9CELL|nr:DUF4012 domain-containing protein [Cellulomonas composti]GEL95838.1 hypothetical protein CCO02nite_24960 [Cellulomonas composti]